MELNRIKKYLFKYNESALTLHNSQRLNSTKIIPWSYTVLYRSMYCKMRNIALFLDAWNSL